MRRVEQGYRDAPRTPIPHHDSACSRRRRSFHATPVASDHNGRWSVDGPLVPTRLALKIDGDWIVHAAHEHVIGVSCDLPTLRAGNRIRCIRALLLEH